MKTCKRCFREFEEEGSLEVSPAAELADFALQGINVKDINDLCPDCGKN